MHVTDDQHNINHATSVKQYLKDQKGWEIISTSAVLVKSFGSPLYGHEITDSSPNANQDKHNRNKK